MKSILSFLFYCLLIDYCFAQDLYRVELKSFPNSDTFANSLKPTYFDSSAVIKITPENVDDYIIKFTDFSFKEKDNHVVTSNRLYFLVGKNKQGNKPCHTMCEQSTQP